MRSQLHIRAPDVLNFKLRILSLMYGTERNHKVPDRTIRWMNHINCTRIVAEN